MLNQTLVYIALAIFASGMLYKLSTWFRFSPGVEGAKLSAWKRAGSALKGALFTFFSPKILTLLKVFLLDVVLQRRILVRSPLKWFMHMSISVCFILLLLMHALSKYITSAFFPGYCPTINPFFFLRDLLGVLVLVGIGIAAFRRLTRKSLHPATNAMDVYALAILALIMVSGIVLEGAKMVSHSAFSDMVDEYTVDSDPDQTKALEAYWVEEFGLVSPAMKGSFDPALLAQGKEVHEMSCAQCHASNRWAFAGYAFAKAAGPLAAPVFDKAGVLSALFYIHFLTCLIGLAYLPFSKMFHIFSVPVCLLSNAVMEKGKSDPANMATKLMVELDSCTHCGSCTKDCSVATAFLEFLNMSILPSERIASIRQLMAGKKPDKSRMAVIQQGIHICTNCGHCTAACTSGIDLTNLWFQVREALLLKSMPEYALLSPLSLYRALSRLSIDEELYNRPIKIAKAALAAIWDRDKLKNKALPLFLGNGALRADLGESVKNISSAGCYRCMTCSASCPIVRNYSNAEEVLGLLPHQMMHAIGLGLWDLVFTSKMLWNCLGCYQCQENCPQCIGIADIICELKNEAVALAGIPAPDGQPSRKDEK